MKSCPICHSSYSDESLFYCLQDGNLLLGDDCVETPTVVQRKRLYEFDSEPAVRLVWNELCQLDSFLNEDLNKFIQSQSRLEVSEWEFINRPLRILEQNRAGIGFELYDFAKNKIFVSVLQRDINDLLDILKRFLQARSSGDESRVKATLALYDAQIQLISTNYLKALTEFRKRIIEVHSSK